MSDWQKVAPDKYHRANGRGDSLVIIRAAAGTWTVTGRVTVVDGERELDKTGYTKYGLLDWDRARDHADAILDNGYQMEEADREKQNRIANLVNEASDLAGEPFFSIRREIADRIEKYAAAGGSTPQQWINRAIDMYLNVEEVREMDAATGQHQH